MLSPDASSTTIISPQGISSCSHSKRLSRFTKSNNPSPVVLKKIRKNMVLHEKYINQLHSREDRRKHDASSNRVVKGKVVGGDKIGIVKATKSALISEAQEVIVWFNKSQANMLDVAAAAADEDDYDVDDEEDVDDEDDNSLPFTYNCFWYGLELGELGSTRESSAAQSYGRDTIIYRNNSNTYRTPSTSSSRTGRHYPSVPDPTEHILPHYLFHHSIATVATGMRVEKGNSMIDALRTTSSSRDEVGLVSLSNASNLEVSEWVEQDEPGVYITIRELPDGFRGLRRVRLRTTIVAVKEKMSESKQE